MEKSRNPGTDSMSRQHRAPNEQLHEPPVTSVTPVTIELESAFPCIAVGGKVTVVTDVTGGLPTTAVWPLNYARSSSASRIESLAHYLSQACADLRINVGICRYYNDLPLMLEFFPSSGSPDGNIDSDAQREHRTRWIDVTSGAERRGGFVA